MGNQQLFKAKNGLLVYAPLDGENRLLFNIGDYIQGLAAQQFFEQIDSYVNRETLNLYDKEPLKVIMNGWFMHHPENWPPSSKILPLFLSFHLNENVKTILNNHKIIEYFKRHAPIGCRDLNTVKLLSEKGIDAYYSSCLTLTLNQSIKKTGEREKIYIVDPIVNHYSPFQINIKDILSYTWILLFNYRLILKMKKKYFSQLKKGYFFNRYYLKNLFNLYRFYFTFRKVISKEVFLNAEYITHLYQENEIKDENLRFQEAGKLLQKYANAKYVITSRIHCALPCLSLETPVIYIQNMDENEFSSCRFSGITELFHVINVSYLKHKIISSFSSEKLTENFSFSNKDLYKDFQKKLVNRCEAFVKNNLSV